MAEQTSVPNVETYHGNCHCGAFRYSVKLPHLEEVTACNCSICTKKGYLWTFPVSNDHFVVEKGDGTLESYEFGNKTMMHKFCPQCGTAIMGQMASNPDIGLNVRSIQDLDLEKLKKNPYDGAARPPTYNPPNAPTPADTEGSPHKYRASCHCGNVSYVLKSEPLTGLEVTDCNCNICARNGCLWIYPPKDTVEIHGEQHLRYYSRYYKSSEEVAGHAFCTTCGVFVLNIFGTLYGDATVQPLNVRVVNGIDVGGLKLKKIDGKTHGQPYVLED